MTITLKTLSTATAQEVYDQVVAHLRKQGKKSYIDPALVNGDVQAGCLYRGPDGLQCAAGCLISDEEYKSEMEGKPWSDVVHHGLAPINHEELIDNLQRIHDSEVIECWEGEFAALARSRGLVYKEPEA